MPELGKATYIVEIDTRGYRRGLRQVNRETRDAEKQQARQLSQMGDNWDEVTARVKRSSREVDRSGSSFSKTGKKVIVANQALNLLKNTIGLMKWPAALTAGGIAVKGLSALVGGASALVSVLGSATSGLVAMAGALGPLSGLMATAATGMLGLVSAFLTVKLGLFGVSDALKAMGRTQAASGADAKAMADKHRSAARSIAAAERALVDSHNSVREAIIGLSQAREDARKQLVDMRLAAQGAELGERRAAISLQEARRSLRESRRDGASSLEQRSALLSVREAELSLRDARLENRRSQDDLREAERKGVRNADQVVEARRSLRDAQYQAAEAAVALADANRDAAASMSEASSSASALGDQLANMPAAGQRFAKFLFSLKPRLQQLRETAASGLLPGVESGIRSAMGNFGVLDRVIDMTSGSLGFLASKAGELFGSKAFGKRFESLGESNAVVLRRMGRAALLLVNSLSRILVAAEPLNKWLAGSALGWAANVDQMTEAGAASGRMVGFFERTRRTLKAVGGSLSNVMHILMGVLGAGERAGFKLWQQVRRATGAVRDLTESTGGRNRLEAFFERSRKSLVVVWRLLSDVFFSLVNIGRAGRQVGMELTRQMGRAAREFREWTGSAEGQNSLKQYFQDIKPVLQEVGYLLRDVTRSFFRIGQSSDLVALLQQLRTDLLPGVVKLLDQTSKRLGPEMVELFTQLAQTWVNLAGASGPIILTLKAMNALLAVVNRLLDNDIIRSAAVWGIVFSGWVKVGRALMGVWRGILAMKVVSWIAGTAAAETSASGAFVSAEARKTASVQATNAALAEQRTLLIANSSGAVVGSKTVGGPPGTPIWKRPGDAMRGLKGAAKAYGPAAGGLLLGLGGMELGSRVGGQAGSAISGAGTGAMLGTMIAPGIGTAIGAAMGTIGGTLMAAGSKAGDKFAAGFMEAIGRQESRIQKMVQGRMLAPLQKKVAGANYALRLAIGIGASDDVIAQLRSVRNRLQEEVDKIDFSRTDFTTNLDMLKFGVITRMTDINRVFQANIDRISMGWRRGGQGWRNATAANMQGAVAAIKAGMVSGTISTRAGIERIRQLWRDIRLVKSEDPFRIARGFRDSWKRAGDINKAEIRRVIEDLQKMKPQARDKARDMMIAYAQQLERSGKLSRAAVSRLTSAITSQFGMTTTQVVSSVVKLAKGVMMGTVSMSDAVRIGMGTIGKNVNSAMSAMGVSRRVTFSLVKGAAIAGASFLGLDGLLGGGAQRRQRGGVIVPGRGSGDKVPALLEPGEVVWNREAVSRMGGEKRVNTVNKLIPRFQSGGAVGDVGGLQPGILQLASVMANKFGMNVSSGLRAADTDSLHSTGQAADFVGGDFSGASRYMNRVGPSLLEGIFQPGMFPGVPVSWDSGKHVSPSFWGAGTWNDHTDHIHGAIEGAGGRLAAVIDKIKRVVLNGPDGPLKDVGQAALDRVRQAANHMLKGIAPTIGHGNLGTIKPGPVGRVFADVVRGLKAPFTPALSLFEAGIVESGMKNLDYGDSSSRGALQLLASTAAGLGVDPMNVAKVAELFLTTGYTGAGGAIPIARSNPGLDAGTIAQMVQGSAFPERYGQVAGEARSLMSREGLRYDGQTLKAQLGGAVSAMMLRRGGGPGVGPVSQLHRNVSVGAKKFPGFDRIARKIKGFGIPSDTLSRLTGLSAEVEKYGEFASNASALTVDPADGGAAVPGVFQGQDEVSWLGKSLESLFALRNTLINAYEYVSKKRAQVEEMVDRARRQLREVLAAIAAGAERRKQLQRSLRQAEANLDRARRSGNRDAIRSAAASVYGLEEQIDGLDMQQRDRKSTRDALRNRLLPALLGQSGGLGTSLSELTGMGGDAYTGLQQVQGVSGPMSPAGPTLVPGQYGGDILDTQLRLRELNARPELTSEFADALGAIADQRAADAVRRANVSAAQLPVFRDFFNAVKQAPPFGGIFHRGGTVPGKKGEDVAIIAQAGEVVSRPDSVVSPAVASSMQQVPNVTVLVEDGAVDASRIRVIYHEEQSKQLSKSKRRVRTAPA